MVGKIKEEVTQALEILNSLKLHFSLQQPKIVSKDWKSSVQVHIFVNIEVQLRSVIWIRLKYFPIWVFFFKEVYYVARNINRNQNGASWWGLDSEGIDRLFIRARQSHTNGTRL